ncbi:nucleoside ABC transporter membrane protein [Jatrophihabitans sp. GAS493]|uniref:ABC transporter permease n=1 Tax=Jatrophihabitans sp. GAS493 TaxID=1907575 RepID=UPI000BB6A6BC|nr:ABC transporter permease [Jatrophihabitans sp. GAS493]SOD71980.1 nucleoside ABC transporter membrane protein [Jatrophihabitans sp. GAS493]
MSALAEAPQSTPGQTARRRRRRRLSTSQRLLLAGGIFVVFVFVRSASGITDLTSAGVMAATISLGIPIALAGLGGLWSERSGVVNIGLEGMMILGTFFAAAFAYFGHSPWLGIVGGIVGGLLGGIIHAVATVSFGVDQIVSGVAINILALGVSRYLAGVFFTGQPGGGPTQSPQTPKFTTVRVPGLDDELGKIEAHHWFLISDIAGLLRGLLTSLNPFTILMMLLFPLTWLILWRTAFGLRLRSCGENPSESESQGVPVYLMKYIAVMISGILAGLAGAYLVNFTAVFREGQTGGRGYIGLAAMIFGNWRPGGLVVGASIFGYTDALQSRSGAVAVHALLLFVAILLVAGGIYLVVQARRTTGIICIVLGVLVYLWYHFTDTLPIELTTYTPQIVTLLVLALASQRLRMPAADGLPWRRGQA